MSRRYLGTHDFTGATVLGVTADPPSNIGSVTVAGSGTSEVPSPDYSSLGAAFAAGHSVVTVVGDTIEDSNVTTASSGSTIYMQDGTVHLLTNVIFMAGELSILGRGELRSNGSNVLGNGGPPAGSVLRIDGVKIDGANAAEPINVGVNTELSFSNMEVVVGNNSTGGIDGRRTRFENVKLSSGGSSAGQIMNWPGGASRPSNASNTIIAGAWNGANLLFLEDDVTIDGVRFENVPPTTITMFFFADRIKVSNFHRNYGNISMLGGSPGHSFIQMDNCSAQFTAFSTEPISDSKFSNCVASGLGGLLSAQRLSSRNSYSNSRLGTPGSASTQTIWGDDNQYDGVTFEQPINVMGSGHIFSNCRFRKALTIDADASGVLLSDCVVQGAFTDSGTDTQGTII
jgi:hypothetical protein